MAAGSTSTRRERIAAKAEQSTARGNTAKKARLHTVLSGEGENLSSRIGYTTSERDGVHAQKSRLAIRATVGKDWDGAAANDNIAWPLATALVREGNTELLKYAMKYRRIYDTAKSEAMLGGATVNFGEGMAIDQRQWIKPNGQIAYKGARTVSTQEPETQPKRKTVADSEEQMSSEKVDSGWTNVPKQWKGDEPVNNMIDAQRELAILQARLGHLCEPFELACIDGATLEAVGNSEGIANRAGAMGAGRALMHKALVTLRDFMDKPTRSAVAA